MKKQRFHKKLTALVLGGLMTFTFGSASAANTVQLNLQDAVQMALENNRSIKSALADVDSARWNLSNYRRQTGVTLSLSSGANRVNDTLARASHQGDNSYYTNSATAAIPLYNFSLRSGIEAAGYALNSADVTLENTKQFIRYQATADYYNILNYKNLIKVQEDTVRAYQEHLDNVNAQYRVGTVAKSDVLSSQVNLANAQQALTTAQNNYDIAVATLNNVLGLPTDTVLEIDDQLKHPSYDLKLEDCTSYALNNRADGAAAYYAVKQAEAGINQAKAGWYPTVTASATKAIEGKNEFKTDHGNTWTIGATANWNIFDNGATSASVHSAEASLAKAQEAMHAQDETIQLDVRTAFLNLQAAEKNIGTTETAVKQAEEDLKIANVRYSAGVGTNLDVMDATEKMTAARTNYNNALYTYNLSKAALDKAMGIPVDIDVAKYKASQMEGNKVKKVREDAKVTENPVLELSPEAKKASKDEMKAMRKAEREARKAAKESRRKDKEAKTVNEEKSAAATAPVATETAASTEAVASEMAQ
ncbi:hypothetical protein SELR_26100 [Selenomonas ruminantium subsp. lactilytica TAM6421]|uniref:Outer membrane protein TolC n=1 Tax=Selenomonas ruminantium subsp. lactilytica (strain NBRC 103574 / TAM6421) TaxID=927704 RepID=I0GU81_SELRL|nr:TolC family protein [Selenomonas ruminantium]BAL84318.1 hypothetical protein SELR_26100 [Selenomonas ruminantium subsp. lactilytica TAM6421]